MKKNKFGEVLRELRVSKNYSQEELGMEADISRNTISTLEKGDYHPRLDTLFRLADALGVEPEDIVRAVRLRQQRKKR